MSKTSKTVPVRVLNVLDAIHDLDHSVTHYLFECQQDSANNSTLPCYLTKNSPLRKIFVYAPMKKDPELFA